MRQCYFELKKMKDLSSNDFAFLNQKVIFSQALFGKGIAAACRNGTRLSLLDLMQYGSLR
jgi:hypothetical protein